MHMYEDVIDPLMALTYKFPFNLQLCKKRFQFQNKGIKVFIKVAVYQSINQQSINRSIVSKQTIWLIYHTRDVQLSQAYFRGDIASPSTSIV